MVNKSGVTNFDEILEVSVSYSLRIKGKLIASEGKGQSIDLTVSDPSNHYVKILGKCNPIEFPIPKGKTAIKPETLRSVAHMRPRTNIISILIFNYFLQCINYNYFYIFIYKFIINLFFE